MDELDQWYLEMLTFFGDSGVCESWKVEIGEPKD